MKEINAAGQSIIVDDITELGAYSSRKLSEIKRMVDATLIKRDYESLNAIVGDIASDGIVTSVEKLELYREQKRMVSGHSVYASQAEAYGIAAQAVYTNYSAAYSDITSYLGVILADMSGSSTIQASVMLNKFEAYYLRASLLEEEIFQYQTGLLNGLDDRTKCELFITCLSGLALDPDGNAVLSVKVLKEGVDCTATMLETDFTWSRSGNWAEMTGKSITISSTDLVNGSANFMCHFKHFYSTSMYWEATNFITVQETVKGDVWNVVIESSAESFKPSEPQTIRYTAHVFLNGVEVTDTLGDSAFQWVRSSRDSPNDDIEWNRVHASGYRSIEFLADGREDAASFTLNVFA